MLIALAACSTADSAESSADEPSSESDGDNPYAGEGEVVFANFGGTGAEAQEAAWYEPFTEVSGITVVQDNSVSWTKLEEMANAGAMAWDVAQGNISYGVTDNPMLEMLDCDVIDCAAFDDAGYPAYPQAVPLLSLAAVLTYNTDTFSEGDLTGMSDFFDPSIDGYRTIGPTGNGWHGVLEAALLTDGVPRDELYPLDVDRALSVFEPIKEQLIVAEDHQQCINDVATGESVLGICNNGRVAIAAQEGYPVAIAWGLQVQEADYIYIPKGAPNLENAQKLIAYIVDNQGAIGNHIAYGPLNPSAAGADPDSEWLDFLPTKHELGGDQAPIYFDLDWWGANRPEVIEHISEWLAG
ncbi:ABC transporter substrate-binding protein [Pseudactinotalea suaedae]